MKNQVGSTRIDTVLKMLAISFVSLFAFCVGVFIGKQMSDSDYQLKALESDFNKKKAHAKSEEHPEDAIADEEVAALSEKYMNSEKEERTVASAGGHGHSDDHGAEVTHGASHDANDEHDAHAAPAAHAPAAKAGAHGKDAHGKAAAHGKKAAAPVAVGHEEDHSSPSDHTSHAPASKGKAVSAKPDLSAAHKAAARVANNVAPTEPAKPAAPTSRLPNSLPKTVGASAEIEFTVQVASYPTAEAAKEHATELVKKGFPAFPVEATIGGRTWYRVSVGSFKSSKEATSYRAQLLRQADLPSAIIQRIQR